MTWMNTALTQPSLFKKTGRKRIFKYLHNLDIKVIQHSRALKREMKHNCIVEICNASRVMETIKMTYELIFCSCGNIWSGK